MGRWIAVDYGLKRIGLAVGTLDPLFTAPLRTISAARTAPQNADLVAQAANSERVVGIVVGLPIHEDDSESEQSRLTRIFAAKLTDAITVPVELFDERLTSFQADAEMAAAEFSAKRRKEMRDALAAKAILDAFFAARLRDQECDDAGTS